MTNQTQIETKIEAALKVLTGKNVVVTGVLVETARNAKGHYTPKFVIVVDGSGLDHPTKRYHHRQSRTKHLTAMGLKVVESKKERKGKVTFELMAA
jgi:uncharacterized protein YegL